MTSPRTVEALAFMAKIEHMLGTFGRSSIQTAPSPEICGVRCTQHSISIFSLQEKQIVDDSGNHWVLSCRYARRAADAPKPWRWRHLAGPGVPMVHPHLCRWRRRVREPRLTLFGPILREGLDARSASGRRLKCASTIWMISPQRKRGKPNAGAALFDDANPLPPGSASI